MCGAKNFRCDANVGEKGVALKVGGKSASNINLLHTPKAKKFTFAAIMRQNSGSGQNVPYMKE